MWTQAVEGPNFAEKLRDIGGLGACPRAGRGPDTGVDPPAHAVVLSVDEKSQTQALDRTQPVIALVAFACHSREGRLTVADIGPEQGATRAAGGKNVGIICRDA
jgi:hypothetical protein